MRVLVGIQQVLEAPVKASRAARMYGPLREEVMAAGYAERKMGFTGRLQSVQAEAL